MLHSLFNQPPNKDEAHGIWCKVWQYGLWSLQGRSTKLYICTILRPELSAKLMLSIFSDSLFTRKTEKNIYFSILQIKLTKTSILPNCQVPNRFFGITVNFSMIEKYKFLYPILGNWQRILPWCNGRQSLIKKKEVNAKNSQCRTFGKMNECKILIYWS